jgi:uncharacterized hydrophobic protein (TIGR00271 family)
MTSISGTPPLVDPHKAEIRAAIKAGASFTVTYGAMNVLATIIACYGLLVDSTAGIIGAMVIALLLGPIAGVGLALVDGNRALLEKALLAELGGVLLVMGTAWLIGLTHRDMPLGRELLARTTPGFADLMIALAGGAAAAIASIARGVAMSLVGVAIATALVPPLSTCSMLLARGAYALAWGAFLLAFTNMVAIQFAVSVVFWVSGYSEMARDLAAGHRVFLRNLVSLVLLISLAVVLGLSTHRTAATLLFEAKAHKLLESAVQNYPGAYLAEVRFGRGTGRTIVRAVVRSPRAFSPQDVAAMERRLPQPPDGSKVELRVRHVPTEVMTGEGPLFDNRDEDGR